MKAALHLRLGRVLHDQFLQGVRALKHFQDAYKLNSALVEALGEARTIYWELGKLNMVQKLLELQLKSAQDNPTKRALYRELGDVLTDLGDYERATESYAKALESSDGQPGDIPEMPGGRAGGSAGLAGPHGRAAPPRTPGRRRLPRRPRCSCVLRASCVASRRTTSKASWRMAYEADPTNSAVARPTRASSWTRSAPTRSSSRSVKHSALERLGRARERRLPFSAHAGRSVTRTVKVGAQLIEEGLRLDPSREEAFTFLRDAWGTKGGDFDRVIRLADELADRAVLGNSAAYLLAEAGLLTWKERGDLIRARRFFERLAKLEPQNPALRAFEAQIGDSLTNGAHVEAPLAAPVAFGARGARRRGAPSPVLPRSGAGFRIDAGERVRRRSRRSAPADSGRGVLRGSEPPAPKLRPPPRRRCAPPRAPRSWRSCERSSPSKRLPSAHHEYVKTLIALGDAVARSAERARVLPRGRRSLRQQVREPGRSRARVRKGAGRRSRSRSPSRTCARCTRSVATGRS